MTRIRERRPRFHPSHKRLQNRVGIANSLVEENTIPCFGPYWLSMRGQKLLVPGFSDYRWTEVNWNPKYTKTMHQDIGIYSFKRNCNKTLHQNLHLKIIMSSWCLSNVALHCMCPLIHRYSSINILKKFLKICDHLKKYFSFFSLGYCKNTICNIYNIQNIG